MPVAGRKPKPDGQKRNRVKPVHDWTEVVDKPFRRGPKLPAKQPTGEPWPPATRQWWRVVSALPHCSLWGPGDWQFALDTAALAAGFHAGELRHGGELRQREKVLGTTVDARRDLRIRYVDVVEREESPGVADLGAYRAALG